jgi:hypothetical protein
MVGGRTLLIGGALVVCDEGLPLSKVEEQIEDLRKQV